MYPNYQSLETSSSQAYDHSLESEIESSSVVHQIDLWKDNSARIIFLTTFVGDSTRGILFPLLYRLTIELGGTLIDYGYIVATFSIGRVLIGTPLGYIGDIYRHKLPLVISCVVVIIGGLVWGNAIKTNSLKVLYFAQLILGLGSGTLGLTRSYIVERVMPHQRTEAISLISAMQYAGFTMSPLLGSGISCLGNITSKYWQYALPGYLISFLSFVCLVGYLTLFENVPIQNVSLLNVKPKSIVRNNLSVIEMKSHTSREKSAVLYLIVTMILLNFFTKGSIAVFETLGSEILINEFGFNIFRIGLLITLCGTIGTVNLLLFESFWAKYFNDLQLMLGGLMVMIVAQVVILCYNQRTSALRYVTGVIMMYAVGYPIGNTAVLGAFSKIQKSGPQAALMSWFATAGSSARIIVPIGSDYLDYYIKNSPFCIIILVLAVSYIAIVVLKPFITFYIETDFDQRNNEIMPSIWTERKLIDKLQILAMLFTASFSIFTLVNSPNIN